jgi:hypothetical protein
MKKYQFRVWFPNPGSAPVAVSVSAFGKDEAIILAQAERINQGQDYRFITVEQVEDESYIVHTARKYVFVKEPDNTIIIKHPGDTDRVSVAPTILALLEHIQKLEKMLCLIKEGGK